MANDDTKIEIFYHVYVYLSIYSNFMMYAGTDDDDDMTSNRKYFIMFIFTFLFTVILMMKSLSS